MIGDWKEVGMRQGEKRDVWRWRKGETLVDRERHKGRYRQER